MAPQFDPLKDLKGAMVDIEAKLPAGLPKLSATLPTLPTGRAGQVGPLRTPTEVFKKVEEILPAGAPRISQMVPKPPLAGEEREPKITGGGVEALPPDRGPKVIGG